MNQCEKIPRQPDEEINSIFLHLIEMGRIVDCRFLVVIEALQNGAVSMANRNKQNGSDFRSMETEIHDMCSRIMSDGYLTDSASPMLVTVIKISSELRCAGDQLEIIVQLIHQVSEQNNALMLPRFSYMQIRQAAILAQGLLQKSLDSFLHRDLNSAIQVMRQDDGEQGNAASIFLVNYMTEHPRCIPSILKTLFIVSAIERISSHARKMSKCVVHMLEGYAPPNILTGELACAT